MNRRKKREKKRKTNKIALDRGKKRRVMKINNPLKWIAPSHNANARVVLKAWEKDEEDESAKFWLPANTFSSGDAEVFVDSMFWLGAVRCGVKYGVVTEKPKSVK